VDNYGDEGTALNAPGTATLTNCSITGNSASAGVGGVYNGGTGTATLTNTIVAGNTGPSSAASDIVGTATGGHNLIGTGGSGGLINGQNGNIFLTSLAGLGPSPASRPISAASRWIARSTSAPSRPGPRPASWWSTRRPMAAATNPASWTSAVPSTWPMS
jgi:hypothetical protein